MEDLHNDRQIYCSAQSQEPLTEQMPYLPCNHCLPYQSHPEASADFLHLPESTRWRSAPAWLPHMFFCVRVSLHIFYSMIVLLSAQSMSFRFRAVRPDRGSGYFPSLSVSAQQGTPELFLLLFPDRNDQPPESDWLYPDSCYLWMLSPRAALTVSQYNLSTRCSLNCYSQGS